MFIEKLFFLEVEKMTSKSIVVLNYAPKKYKHFQMLLCSSLLLGQHLHKNNISIDTISYPGFWMGNSFDGKESFFNLISAKVQAC